MHQMICCRRHIVKAVSKVGKFSEIACSDNLHYLMLSYMKCYAEKQHGNSFACHSMLWCPGIMPYRAE